MSAMVVVTGPPCAGKTTHVQSHRSPGDLVIDLDAIAHGLGYPTPQIDWADRDHPAVAAARTVRTTLVKELPAGSHTTWVIDSNPHPISRRIWKRQGVTVIDLTTDRDTCHARAHAAGRPTATHDQIRAWFDQNFLNRKP